DDLARYLDLRRVDPLHHRAHGSDPEGPTKLRDLGKPGLPLVGLVQDVEVLLRQADAAEAVCAAAASDAAHELSPADASLASLAVRAREASRRGRGVGALGAIGAIGAVVRARDVRAALEERGVDAALTPLAGDAVDVRGHALVRARQRRQPLLELRR